MGMSEQYLRAEQEVINELREENDELNRKISRLYEWLCANDVGRGGFLVETDYDKTGLWGEFCKENPDAKKWPDRA